MLLDFIIPLATHLGLAACVALAALAIGVPMLPAITAGCVASYVIL